MIENMKVWLTPIRQLTIVLIALAVLIGFIGYMADLGIWTFVKPVQTLVLAFYANVSAELGSILLTILVIDALNEKRTKAQEKRRLIQQMGSPDNGFALEAVRISRAEGWLEDGSLKGVNLWEANLAGARMWRANFENVSLEAADLTGANLSGANLTGAILWNTNLAGAELRNAIIDGATFEGATLPDGTRLPGRTWDERNDPEPDWRTPFATWDQAGRPTKPANAE